MYAKFCFQVIKCLHGRKRWLVLVGSLFNSNYTDMEPDIGLAVRLFANGPVRVFAKDFKNGT